MYARVDNRCMTRLVTRPLVHSRAGVRRFPRPSTGLCTAFPPRYPQTCGWVSDTDCRSIDYRTHGSTGLSPTVVHSLWTTFLERRLEMWERGRGSHDADCLTRLVS